MRFLVDQNLPVVLAAWLNERGHETEHVRLLGLAEEDDRVILDLARAKGAVVISKDGDFTSGAPKEPRVPVVWIRIGNTTNERLIGVWEGAWASILEALEAGETVVEVDYA
jgi:predicted nuclease of predicted toxin-antitoxin system